MPAHFPSMVRACYDMSLYGEVTRQRARRTVGYFALMVVLSSLIIATVVTFQFRGFLKKEVYPELGRLPVVTIKDHLASANVEQPWRKFFKDENTGLKTIFVIDTTGHTTDFQSDEQGFIVTRTQLLMRSPQNPMLQPLNFSDVDDVVVDATMIERWSGLAVKVVFVGAAVGLPLWYTASKLVQALLFALIGLIFNTMRRRGLRFGQIFSLAIYALTPAIVLDVLAVSVLPQVPHFWLIYSVIACAFLAVAVRKVADDEPLMPPVNYPPTAGPPGIRM